MQAALSGNMDDCPEPFRVPNMDDGLRTRRNSFSIKITSFRSRISPSAKLKS